MIRKECDYAGCLHARSGGTRSVRPPLFARRVAVVALLLMSTLCAAGEIRVHATAVVTDATIRVEDVCEVQGFDAETTEKLTKLVIVDSPVLGGSRLVSFDALRSVVGSAVKLSQVTIRGATQCAVSRPSDSPDRDAPKPNSKKPIAARTIKPTDNRKPSSEPASTVKFPMHESLRQAVVDHFNQEFARYGGSAEVVFDHTSEQVLDLSGPAYQFRVRPKQSQLLGLCPLEVDVLTGASVVQTVPLVVQATMTRHVVVAKRTINQDAAIQAADVNLAALSFTKLDELGVADLSQVIGQRAKRVITAGSLVEMENLESVPLVLRGQLVSVISEVAGIRVVTTGKAAMDGRRGEVIKVRSVDDKKVEYDAVVVAPGQVRLGVDPMQDDEPRLALGGKS